MPSPIILALFNAPPVAVGSPCLIMIANLMAWDEMGDVRRYVRFGCHLVALYQLSSRLKS